MSRAVVYKVHPNDSGSRKIVRTAQALRDGALIVYPTDTVYGVGCDPRSRPALARLRALKQQTSRTPLTLLCASLAEAGHYGWMNNEQFRLIKALTPGPYTFLLEASKETPRLVLAPKRKTVGLRVPDHTIAQALMRELAFPLVSGSARRPDGEPAETREELFDALDGVVDVILDDETSFGSTPSTVLDLTAQPYEIVREGLGLDALTAFMR